MNENELMVAPCLEAVSELQKGAWSSSVLCSYGHHFCDFGLEVSEAATLS